MMPQMLSSLQSPSVMILPLVAGLAVFTLLLIIRRLLRRMGGIRGFGIAYLLGALGLGVAFGATIIAIEQDQSIDLTFRSVLLAILICSWGLVALGLIEHLLLKYWLGQGRPAIPRLALDIGRALATRRAPDAPQEEISRPTLVRRIRQIFGLNGRSAAADHR
jgi:predicted MFS family arabinose efflux permease